VNGLSSDIVSNIKHQADELEFALYRMVFKYEISLKDARLRSHQTGLKRIRSLWKEIGGIIVGACRLKLITDVTNNKNIIDTRDCYGSKMNIVWETDDGTVLTLRHISANDVCCLTSFVRGLSFSTRYFRFGSGDFNPGEDEILRVCTPDSQQCEHSLAVVDEKGKDKVIGSARYVIQSDTCCEFAIAVTDSWRHHGVGHQLMNVLIESAKNRGIKEMPRWPLQNPPVLATQNPPGRTSRL